MGRPSKSTHPIAVARKLTGKTQLEFAALVGVSKVAIQRIESGDLPLTRALADKIGFAIGVEPESICDLSRPHPCALGSTEAYTENSFLYWRLSFANNLTNDDQRVVQYAEVLKEEVEALLFASNAGMRRKFRLVLWALCQAVAQIGAEFDLGDAIASVRKGNAGPEDPAAYELSREHAFLYRSLKTTDFGTGQSLPVPGEDVAFVGAEHIPGLNARTMRSIREFMLNEIRQLSRRPTRKSHGDKGIAQTRLGDLNK